MKNEKIVKVVATGILVAGLVAPFGGSALAGSNSITGNSGAANIAAGKTIVYGITQEGNISSLVHTDAKQTTLKEALADLVTAGTITQDQSDAVLTYFQQHLPQKPVIDITAPVDEVIKSGQGPVVKIVDPLKDLVDKGTITEDQAQSIRDKMRDITDQHMQQQWQTSLDTLVSEGTITRDQADNILTFLEANNQKMHSMLEQTHDVFLKENATEIKDMSQEQRPQYFKENLGDIKDPVSQMFEQGIINQQQADALREAMPSLPKIVRLQKPSPEQLQANLDTMVAEETITRDQATEIQAFLTDNNQKMKSMLDQTKDMSQEERIQYLKENLGNIKDPVSQMVNQGIITQQQADAVREAVTGSSGAVTNDGSLGSGLSGGQDVFYSISGAASDDSQN